MTAPRASIVLTAALLLGSGCLFPLSGLTEGRVVRTGVGDFVLKWSPKAPRDQERVAQALERASAQLLQWGKLKRAVNFYLFPTHTHFEVAVRSFGYEWLHAWAGYGDVYFESPSSWDAAGPDIDELVLHELTHCLMYQRSAGPDAWTGKQIPFWFREGMATWTARQGPRWASVVDLKGFYEKNPDADPILRPEELYEKSTDTVYAASQRAFELLVQRYEVPAVLRLMDTMSQGHTFAEAFEIVTGISAATFIAEFRQSVLAPK
jgi:hypothetical protein